MKINIKKLSDKAVVPKYSKPGDAGMDLTCTRTEYNEETDILTCHTDIAVEIPENYVGLLFSRSSIHKQSLSLANAVGVIDSGFRAGIQFKFRVLTPVNLNDMYTVGDRVGQLIILPYPQIEFEEVEQLSETERGFGGFGSTNIK